METQYRKQESSARPSLELLELNNYCILRIFDNLNIFDAVNFAETCFLLSSLSKLIFTKYSTFRIAKFGSGYSSSEYDYLYDDITFLDLVFRHIGQYVLSLHISCDNEEAPLPVLNKVMEYSQNLKSLAIGSWKDRSSVVPAFAFLASVETLTLMYCDLRFCSDFFGSFGKLKYLNLQFCDHLNFIDWFGVLQINSNIESLVINYTDNISFNSWVKSLAKLQRLFITHIRSMRKSINPLIRLDQLTKLRVHNNDNVTITILLTELATKGILEELELENCTIDEKLLDKLRAFEMLQLLAIRTANKYNVKNSLAWPPNLKHLDGFELSYNGFISAIKQLKSLENMNLLCCSILYQDQNYFRNLKNLSQQIKNETKKHRITVVLPFDYANDEDYSKKCLIEAVGLKILNNNNFVMNKDDPAQVAIHFPGTSIGIEKKTQKLY